MIRRLDGKQIQPSYLTPDVYDGSSIVARIVLASSNALRLHLGIKETETIRGPIPRFVTRKNASLDNYFAELLLRTCYEPVDELPVYEEHVIRGSEIELPSDLNPRLVGSVLIGIGGRSKNPDFKKVYDEHAEAGTRRASSATEMVYREHLERFQDRPGVAALAPVLKEINSIDSKGGAFFDHLAAVTKSLHVAQFRQPGFVAECLEPQWKRAILGAILTAVCLSVKDFETFDNSASLKDLEQELDNYLQKRDRLVANEFLDRIDPAAVAIVKNANPKIGTGILKPNQAEIEGAPSYFTQRRILYALKKVWPPNVVSFLMGFLFEAMCQDQHEFVEITSRPLNIREDGVPRSCCFLYYEKQLTDKIPHKAILKRINDQNKRGIVVIHDPVRLITAVCKTKFLPAAQWERMAALLVEAEGEGVWYVIKQPGTDKAGNFVLNGTEYFVGVEMTKLEEEDFFRLFKKAVS